MGYIKMSAFKNIARLYSNYRLVGHDAQGNNIQISFEDFWRQLDIEASGGAGQPIFFTGTQLPSENNTGEALVKGDWTFLPSGKIYTNINTGNPIEAPLKRISFSIFNGTSWSLVDMGELPQATADGHIVKGETRAVDGDEIFIALQDKVDLDVVATTDNRIPPYVGDVLDVVISNVDGEDSVTTGGAITEVIPVKGNTEYFLSGKTNTDNNGARCVDIDGNILPFISIESGVDTYVWNNNTARRTHPDAIGVQITWRSASGGNRDQLMLNIGRVALPYKPYEIVFNQAVVNHPDYFMIVDEFTEGGGNQKLNKNGKTIDGYRIASTGLDFAEVGASYIRVKVKENTLYTVSGRTNTNIGARAVNANGGFMQMQTPAGGNIGYTMADNIARLTPAGTVYVDIVWKNGNVGSLENVMFNEGSSAMPVEDYIAVIRPDKLLVDISQALLKGGYTGTGATLNAAITSNSNRITPLETDNNTNKDNISNLQNGLSNAEAAISTKIPYGDKGVSGGVVPLNNNGKIDPIYIDVQGLVLLGNWNAATNTPTLSNGTGTENTYYIVGEAGTVNFGNGDITFAKGDKVIYSSNGQWVLDQSKDVPAPVSTEGLNSQSEYIRVGDGLFNIFNQYTKVYNTFIKVTEYPNGLAITDENIDGRLYVRIGTEYFGDARFISLGEVPMRNYGIRVNGITNDVVRLQELVDFLYLIGGGKILFPVGRLFLGNAGVKWRSNVSMVGNGWGASQIMAATDGATPSVPLGAIYNTDMPSNGSIFLPLVGITLSDFKIDCSGYHNLGVSSVGRKGIFILGMSGSFIERVEVFKSIGTGIGCDFLTDTALTNNYVHDCGMYIGDGATSEIGQSGIGIGTNALADEPVKVEGNWCYNNGNYQIFVESQDNPSGVKSYGAMMMNNSMVGGRYGLGNKGSGAIQALGNKISEAAIAGIHHPQTAKGSVYNDNEISYCKNGIQVHSTGGDSADSMMIQGNKIHHNTDYGYYDLEGRIWNLDVSNNHIHHNGLSGAIINHHHKFVTFNGNKVYNNGQRGTANNNFGLFSRAGYFNVVQGNTFFDDQEVRTQSKGIKVYRGYTIPENPENPPPYVFPVIKPTLYKGNNLMGYAAGDGISIDAAAVDGTDYILDGNLELS